MKIGTRVGLSFGVVVVIIGLLVAAIQISLQQAKTNSRLLQNDLRLREQAASIGALARENVVDTLILLITPSAQLQSQLLQQLAQRESKIAAAIQELEKALSDEAAVQPLVTELKQRQASYKKGVERIVALIKSGKNAEAAFVADEELLPTLNPLIASITKLDFDREQALGRKTIDNNRLIVMTQGTMWGGGLMTVVLALVAGVLLVRSITGRLNHAVALAERVAQSDLTVRASEQGEDELARLLKSLNKMTENLARVVQSVRQGADFVAASSGELAHGNHDLSSRTEQQASSLQQTAESVEQLTGAVRQSSASASQANTLAASASQAAKKGGVVVEQVVNTMGQITASSRKISEIIGVIDGIAFQTNILALNAAVEAARAGEQGRGFAVVAAEVRQLAKRSADAAKEIKSLINESVQRVDLGSAQVFEAGNAMQDIVAEVNKVTDLIAEITSATSEQSQGITEVSTAINQMDRFTQQNAALVEQGAAATQSLKDRANELAQAVAVFKLTTTA